MSTSFDGEGKKRCVQPNCVCHEECLCGPVCVCALAEDCHEALTAQMSTVDKLKEQMERELHAAEMIEELLEEQRGSIGPVLRSTVSLKSSIVDPRAGHSARDLASAWLYHTSFDFVRVPREMKAKEAVRFARVVLAAASGTENFTEAQRTWVMSYFAARGAPQDALEEMAKLPTKPLSPNALEELLLQQGISALASRTVAYDSIRVCFATNGYREDQSDVVHHIGQILDLETQVISGLEAYAKEETALRKQRLALLSQNNTLYTAA